jgi:hypothetical protein
MDTIQIEITNACINDCSNCTRFCGHFSKPYFMPLEEVKKAINSLEDFPKMVGIMGGEPLLHPQFEEICLYLKQTRPNIKCGLWSCFPKGKERYAKLICDTFGSVLLNDHSLDPGITHQPVLTAIKDYVPDEFMMWFIIEHCRLQRSWSAAINPRGAFFCEIAASLSLLFNKSGDDSNDPAAWPVEKGWWKKNVIDFHDQMRCYCPKCGMAINFKQRIDNEGIDDISPSNLELMAKSGNIRKISRGQYHLYNEGFSENNSINSFRQNEMDYFNAIASRYNIKLSINEIKYPKPDLI